MIRRPRSSTLFPYTTLFRSRIMALKDTLLSEFDHEMGTTRRLLERLPDGELVWKPHEKSMTIGGLATQDRKSTRLNSSHTVNSYAGLGLKKKRQGGGS